MYPFTPSEFVCFRPWAWIYSDSARYIIILALLNVSVHVLIDIRENKQTETQYALFDSYT